jgi:hypothetical protein
VIDTAADPNADGEPKPVAAADTLKVDGRAVVVLQAASL